jgi:phenylpropionate dioxygenase-like ring-hydroxylating dioxygenase large terminal subunit
MLSRADNEFLTQSGAGTPMGQLLRRFWVPALLAAELPERDGPPRKIRIMGEDLLAFRDSDGRIGIVEPHCPHRGANLYFGRNEECGLRCAFHGWKFDVEGNCVDLPTSPPESTYKDTIKLLAYPVREWGDIVWVYMGPREEIPELPQLELGLVPTAHRYVSKKWQDCNWVQSLEGAIDTAHFSFLHNIPTKDVSTRLDVLRQSSAIGAQKELEDRIRWVMADPRPKFAIRGHDAGLVIGAARKTDGPDLYWRLSQFLMPNHALVPVAFPGDVYHGQTWVPVDDTNCWIFTYSWVPDRPLTNTERTKYASGLSLHAEVDDHYMPIRNVRNDYMIDREAQKTLSYTGIKGVSEQDAAIQDSQGPIQDRTREHLGPTDVGIVEFRKMIMGTARALQAGTSPKAPTAARRYAVRAGGWMAGPEKDLVAVMTERFGHRDGYIGSEYGFGE